MNAGDKLLDLFDGDCKIYAVRTPIAQLPWFEEYVKEKLMEMGGGVWTQYLGIGSKADWYFIFVRRLDQMPEGSLEDKGYKRLCTFMLEEGENGRMKQTNLWRSEVLK
jgi:hypothetical protein